MTLNKKLMLMKGNLTKLYRQELVDIEVEWSTRLEERQLERIDEPT